MLLEKGILTGMDAFGIHNASLTLASTFASMLTRLSKRIIFIAYRLTELHTLKY